MIPAIVDKSVCKRVYGGVWLGNAAVSHFSDIFLLRMLGNSLECASIDTADVNHFTQTAGSVEEKNLKMRVDSERGKRNIRHLATER